MFIKTPLNKHEENKPPEADAINIHLRGNIRRSETSEKNRLISFVTSVTCDLWLTIGISRGEVDIRERLNCKL